MRYSADVQIGKIEKIDFSKFNLNDIVVQNCKKIYDSILDLNYKCKKSLLAGNLLKHPILIKYLRSLFDNSDLHDFVLNLFNNRYIYTNEAYYALYDLLNKSAINDCYGDKYCAFLDRAMRRCDSFSLVYDHSFNKKSSTIEKKYKLLLEKYKIGMISKPSSYYFYEKRENKGLSVIKYSLNDDSKHILEKVNNLKLFIDNKKGYPQDLTFYSGDTCWCMSLGGYGGSMFFTDLNIDDIKYFVSIGLINYIDIYEFDYNYGQNYDLAF